MRVRRIATLLTPVVAVAMFGGGMSSAGISSAARRVRLIEKRRLVVSNVTASSATAEAVINTTKEEPTSYVVLLWAKCPPKIDCTVPIHEVVEGTVRAGSEGVTVKGAIRNIPERSSARYGYVAELRASNSAGVKERSRPVLFKLP
jgi:hypothetical protein